MSTFFDAVGFFMVALTSLLGFALIAGLATVGAIVAYRAIERGFEALALDIKDGLTFRGVIKRPSQACPATKE